jgi:DNA-binding IclR family transcriptional regulator
MIVALTKRSEELRARGFYITSHADDPLILCCTSPIMRRAAELACATDVVFVDSTSTVDAQGISVTFMLTATVAEAVPLCVLLHSGQSEEIYTRAFSRKTTFVRRQCL